MKKTIVIILALFHGIFPNAIVAQTDCDLTLVKNINIEKGQDLTLAVDAQVDTQSWDLSYIKIVVRVRSNFPQFHILNQLNKNGRFSIAIDQTTDGAMLSMPHLRKQITVNGKDYTDSISLQIFLPNEMQIHGATGFQLAIR